MSSEDNKALVQRFFEEVFNQKRVDRAGEFVAPDYPDKGPAWRERSSSGGRCTSLPSPICTPRLTRLLAEGDKVTARFTVEGTRAMGIAGRPAHRETLPDQ